MQIAYLSGRWSDVSDLFRYEWSLTINAIVYSIFSNNNLLYSDDYHSSSFIAIKPQGEESSNLIDIIGR